MIVEKIIMIGSIAVITFLVAAFIIWNDKRRKLKKAKAYFAGEK